MGSSVVMYKIMGTDYYAEEDVTANGGGQVVPPTPRRPRHPSLGAESDLGEF